MQEAYEDAELQRILAEDSAIAELGIDVQRHGESLVVRGHVETEQRRADIGRRVAELVPQCLVLNEITVVTARRPDAPEEADMIRVAAVGDVHVDADVLGRFRPALDELGECADVLLLAGDLTRHGTADEAACVATEFGGLNVPVVAVLGNHDYHSDQADQITQVLTDAGLRVLEGDSTVIDCAGGRLGIAGAKGFGGGFAGRCASAFGEPEMKQFVRHSEASAERLAGALTGLDCDVRVALMHYSPVPDTLVGEPLEIYPFLGSYLLGQAIDGADVALAVHGHAHLGTERGMTPGGVRVRNVAHPVIRQAFSVFHLAAVPTPVDAGLTPR